MDHIGPDVVFENQELKPPQAQMHSLAISRARKYIVAEAELLSSIIEVDRERLFHYFGLTHLTPYCIQQLGLTGDVAAMFVRVARRCHQVPELKQAIDQGRLTLSKARVIASVITPENQYEWIELAASVSKDKLEREVAEASPDQPQPERARAKKNGLVRLELDVTKEQMVDIRRAQELLAQKWKKMPSLSETVAAMAADYLERRDPVRKAERAAERSGSVEVAADQSQDRSDEIPAAIIHQVNLRDRGECQARLPNGRLCRSRMWVQLHHKLERSKGGEHTLENLVTICAGHHQMWHARRDAAG